MKFKIRTILLGLCCLFILTGVSHASTTEEQVLAAAFNFVDTIDSGNTMAAYWSGSNLLRLANPEKDWVKSADRNIKVLGKTVARKLSKLRTVNSFASLPDNEYRIALYNTRTEYKQNAFETLLLHQVDGVWQVCYYHIH